MTRNEVRAEQRPRRRVIVNPMNKFEFDETRKPPGMRYKWSRITLAGQEDRENQIVRELNGWTPVPADRHPELSGLGAKSSESIVRGGLMLVELPEEEARESDETDQFQARNELETQIQRLGQQARREGAKGIRRQRDSIPAEIVE